MLRRALLTFAGCVLGQSPTGDRFGPLGGTPPIDALCRPFCKGKSHGWEKLCSWAGCAGCSECAQGSGSGEEGSGEEGSGSWECQGFCAAKTQYWDALCSWTGCGGCTECMLPLLEYNPTMPPLVTGPPAPVCKAFCETKSQAWDEKCTWGGCNGCSECGAESECKPFCETKTQPWSEKCSWNGCSACCNSGSGDDLGDGGYGSGEDSSGEEGSGSGEEGSGGEACPVPAPTQDSMSCRDEPASYDGFVSGTSPDHILETCKQKCRDDPACNYLSFWQPLPRSLGRNAWCRLTASCDNFWPGRNPRSYDIYVIPKACLSRE
ncbi:hypothetical protein EMIHUDRAFT_205889 [Emiliania huxleyi CCMP1516]|uniref:Apple domain-containing protein n=2 Tax=Emiliania huxleyi TaxID=2903 RepID=A0A0D3JQI6_EMIH1|nr:hypothetical protein EMIHUDRAFT_205889 [Emiliania huxleyi CCMP1516]EOD25771.1 hypothetical protein EMIHUDRAFT_205889 [Emiliania huxleyi CCMP1516]|eukprot:XP_005778200.1 hypothetical protein EMIHUDRAFT_205889 [Emiliania huxleyi CCMP1516]